MRTCPGRTCRPRPALGNRPAGGAPRACRVRPQAPGTTPARGRLAEAGGAGAVAGVGPPDDGCRPRFGAQLCVDPVYVVFDGFLGENELGSDFTVGVPVRDERHDFGLAYGKA